MKIIGKQSVSFILFLCWATHVSAGTINFNSLSPGDSIEGLGTVHPLLNISTSQSSSVALFEGVSPTTYGAPNGGLGVLNGNISSNGGFGDISANRLNDFIFTFASGVTISNFSLRMLDYGDYNPGGATLHTVTLEALNAIGNIIDQSVLSYTSDSTANPTSGSAGNLFFTGDAMTANFGEPGNFLFSVSGADITAVRWLYSDNGSRPGSSDPNIAFDSLNITFVPIPGAAILFISGLSLIFGLTKRHKMSAPI